LEEVASILPMLLRTNFLWVIFQLKIRIAPNSRIDLTVFTTLCHQTVQYLQK